MSWRGQGGKRAKGRRGDQDPEVENTAWLAELEQAAGQDDDEDDWVSTLRGRRTTTPPPQPPPEPEPEWTPPPPDQGAVDGASVPDPDWSWRSPDAGVFDEPGAATQADPDPGWDRYGEAARPDPVRDAYGGAGQDPAPDPFGGAGGWADPGGSGAGEDSGGWRPAGADTPTGAWDAGEPLGREPDYPALFGELYRRSAAQQDPIWEAPPAAEPMPEQGPPDPPSAAWPFEETTQSWEPSDRSFIWPSDELPSTQTEWDQPRPATDWPDDPAPQPGLPPEPDQTTAWPGPGTASWEEPAAEPAPESRSPLWGSQPGAGNGVPPSAPPTGPATSVPLTGSTTPAPPPPAGPVGPPPDDWASAIPTDVPAARRAADPSATGVWRTDEAADAEPGVPLGPGNRARPAGTAGGARRERRAARDPRGGATELAGGDPGARTAPRPARGAYDAAADPGATPIDTGKGRRNRQGGERQARAWPRVVAVISWIVLVMVLCWYYVFPWLERVLPENF
jgi:hypothetical protein